MKPNTTKIWNMVIALIIAGLFTLPAAGLAAEKQKVQETAVASASAHTLAYGKEAVIRGVIEKTETGIYLLDGKASFQLEGEDNLAALVGQPVEVKGLLKKGETNNILLVEQVKVID